MSVGRFLHALVLALAVPGMCLADEKDECIAAADQGQTLRDQSKLLDARAQFAQCVRETCPGALRKDCAQFLRLVDEAIPALVITAKEESGREIVDVTVTEKKTVLADKLDGRALTLDPGEHVFHFVSVGRIAFDTSVIVKQGDKNQTLVVQFPADSTPKRPAVPSVVPSPTNGRKTMGIVVGSVGIGATLVGAVFGGVAASSWSDAKNKCGGACGPSDPAQQSLSAARTTSAVSTTLFIVGPILLATGVVVFLTAPKSKLSVGVTPTASGVLIIGSF